MSCKFTSQNGEQFDKHLVEKRCQICTSQHRCSAITIIFLGIHFKERGKWKAQAVCYKLYTTDVCPHG